MASTPSISQTPPVPDTRSAAPAAPNLNTTGNGSPVAGAAALLKGGAIDFQQDWAALSKDYAAAEAATKRRDPAWKRTATGAFESEDGKTLVGKIDNPDGNGYWENKYDTPPPGWLSRLGGTPDPPASSTTVFRSKSGIDVDDRATPSGGTVQETRGGRPVARIETNAQGKVVREINFNDQGNP